MGRRKAVGLRPETAGHAPRTAAGTGTPGNRALNESEELLRYRVGLEQLVRERTTELERTQLALVNLVEDLSEQQEQLERANARLAELDRLKSAFLASMSHELRTPLNSIIGFTGILLQRMSGPLTGEQERQLGMVKRSAHHLLELINDILDLSKIEAGELRLVRQPVEPEAVIDEALRAVRPQADGKRLTLAKAIDAAIGPITSDRRRLLQVLINLLDNAIKFTDQGGVTIAARRVTGGGGGAPPRREAPGPLAPAPAGREGDWIEITVADTGIGIRPQDLGRLFVPFGQLDAGLARPYNGTGLGLSICRRLVGLLGGEIRVESAPGEGSRFIFTVPAT